jgi:protein-L-isoaspartate O-methyltransferase
MPHKGPSGRSTQGVSAGVPQSITVVQGHAIIHFDAEPGSNAILLQKGCEHLPANWSDQTGKPNLAHYLKGAASS